MSESVPLRIQTERPAVLLRGVHKHYGRTRALAGLDLTVPEGSVYLLVGPNGSGKTTTMKLLLDLVRSGEGSTAVFGLDPVSSGPQVRALIGYVPEQHTLGYPWMRTGRLLQHHATYYPAWDDSYTDRLVKTLEIDRSAKYGKLSKGEARRIHFVMALAHRPPLLLFDEPMDGLDPFVRGDVIALLADHLAENPTTVLASTHHIEELSTLADHLGVIRTGRLVAETDRATLDGLLRTYRMQVPAGWAGVPELTERVLRRNGTEGEVVWTVWGEEEETIEQFKAAGATVRDAVPLRLEEAALALLSRELRP
jgi:ABC-2 type transport system ATP-binding protein